MVSKSTVFVLGAGASQPFDFPTGQELYRQILVGLASPRNQLYQQLQRFGDFSDINLQVFRESLQSSGRASVDAFLEHRPEFMAVGKAAMAARLIACEHPDTLFDKISEWMHYLYGYLDHPFKSLKANDLIAFITFNYDRSLEHFLFSAFKNSYGASDEECALAVERMPIIHLHGSLGKLPWQSGSGTVRPYNNQVDGQTLRAAAFGIKIVHEDITDGRDKEFEIAKRLINIYDRVYFLGFGYGTANLNRLAIETLPRQAAGTGMGLTHHEVSQLRTRTYSKINILNQYDCIGFLRNHAEWN